MAHPFAGQRVAVVMGGLSAEREVSLNTGAGVLAALQEKSWDVVGIDWKPGTSLARLVEDSRARVVWNALHGTFGEDGAVQGLCACMGLPCTGSGILASALAMDKVMSKRIFESNGVPTPRWKLLAPGDELADWPLPCVVKPACEGSSVGVSIVERAEHHALAAYTALGCSGHARPDLRIATTGEPYVLEVNTLPGMTKTSLLPKIAKSVGMDYATLCEQILATAR